MRILIVEDQVLVAVGLAAELEDAGHEVVGLATNPADALSMARSKHPTLALVDIDLQEHRDGLRVARDLKRGSNIPSLFLTGQVELARQNADVALGVVGKPFNPHDVVRTICVLASLLEGGDPPPPPIPVSLELFKHAKPRSGLQPNA